VSPYFPSVMLGGACDFDQKCCIQIILGSMSEIPFPHSQNCVAFYTIQSISLRRNIHAMIMPLHVHI
jgi:hypothetical protein